MTRPGHVLVTGATGQLGGALARRLASHSRRLSLCALEPRLLQTLGSRIEEEHGISVDTTVIDVRQPAQLGDWIRACDAKAPIDWVIVNAGLGGQIDPGDILEDADRAADLVDTNLKGALNTIHAALPPMRARGRGRLIVVSSLSAFAGFDRAPVYAATKAALRILCLSIRPALASDGIGLTLACPGFLDRPMQDSQGQHAWRPFSISPEAAAAAIVKAAGKGRAQAHFPFAMATLVRTLALMPLPWREALYRRMSDGETLQEPPAKKGAPLGAP